MFLKTIPRDECCRYITKIYKSPYTRKRALVYIKKNKRHIVMRMQDAQIAHDVVCSDSIFAPEVTVSLVITFVESEDDVLERLRYIVGFMVLFNMCTHS